MKLLFVSPIASVSHQAEALARAMFAGQVWVASAKEEKELPSAFQAGLDFVVHLGAESPFVPQRGKSLVWPLPEPSSETSVREALIRALTLFAAEHHLAISASL